MEIKTKYNIGQEVYVLDMYNGTLNISIDRILGFTYQENDGEPFVEYILEELDENSLEKYIVPIPDKELLIKRIDELLKD